MLMLQRGQPVRLTIACGLVLAALVARPIRGQTPSSPPPTVAGGARPPGQLWKSHTTGNEYWVTVDGANFQAEQTNIPKDATHAGSYVRATARRQGTKWVGKTEIFLPCALGHGPVINKCHLTMGFEITEMGSDLIRGRIENPDLNQFDCKSCNAPKREWKDFVWVPKKQ